MTGAEIDAFAAVAIELNARANGCRVAVMHHNVLDDEVSEVVVILARKCWYDAALADQRWRGSIGLALAGTEVLVGGDAAAGTCQPATWSSLPLMTSAPRRSSRTSSTSGVGSSSCVGGA